MPIKVTPRTVLSNFVHVCCKFFGQFWRLVRTKIRPSSITIRSSLLLYSLFNIHATYFLCFLFMSAPRDYIIVCLHRLYLWILACKCSYSLMKAAIGRRNVWLQVCLASVFTYSYKTLIAWHQPTSRSLFSFSRSSICCSIPGSCSFPSSNCFFISWYCVNSWLYSLYSSNDSKRDMQPWIFHAHIMCSWCCGRMAYRYH